MTVSCPICAVVATARSGDGRYWICPACEAWFQSPMPTDAGAEAGKSSGEGRTAAELMSEHDRSVNSALAEVLFHELLSRRPSPSLDVGSGYPYLAHCLRRLRCDSFALDRSGAVAQHAAGLGVPMLVADFEQIPEVRIADWSGTDCFGLITLIHAFEYLRDPRAALVKLRRLVADDGRVFIRMPDHGVAGFEHRLSSAFSVSRPFVHSLESILELLAQKGDLFAVAHSSALDGLGQRDLTLRPLVRKPTVFAGLIVKNEERDLPRCLRSIEPAVDGVVVVDTGSTDDTLAVAASTITTPVHVQTDLGASRRDENGDWKLYDFSKARNVFVEEIERRGADFVLWMDADDELLTPARLRRATFRDEPAVFGVQIESADQRWTQHRLWRTGAGIHFEGRCHEYPTIGGHPSLLMPDVVIRHDATPGTGETANARNLRILLEAFAEQPSPRTAFYLGNTHRDGGRFAEAVPWYARRIAMGEGYRDEWLFAHLYMGRCQRAAGDLAAAERTLLEGTCCDRGWAEFWMELAWLAYSQARHRHAIGYALQAVDVPIPPTQLWRERNAYTDQPLRLVSWCHEHLGEMPEALAWALRARTAIGVPDAEWDARIARLEAMPAPPAAGNVFVALPRPALAMHRPGAIGDILMTLNLVQALRQAYPGRAIHYFCHRDFVAGLMRTMRAAGIDAVEDCSGLGARRGEFERVFDLVGYPLAEGYPERPMRRHIVHYFAAELGLDGAAFPALVLPRPARLVPATMRYATLQVKAGWSTYKEWPLARWDEVISECAGIPAYQIDRDSASRVVGACHDFIGAPLDMAIALVANANLHIGIDSFANHLTHYRWRDGADDSEGRSVPGVILWGSTQASALGYRENVNLSLDLPCQPCFREDPARSRMPRGPCVNPPGQTYAEPRHACMLDLDVPGVIDAVRRAWNTAP